MNEGEESEGVSFVKHKFNSSCTQTVCDESARSGAHVTSVEPAQLGSLSMFPGLKERRHPQNAPERHHPALHGERRPADERLLKGRVGRTNLITGTPAVNG